jgi:tetratricopeptide (TPR) repeat protein
MSQYPRIQRYRSGRQGGLSFRSQRRSALPAWVYLVWLPTVLLGLLAIWQAEALQPRVLALVGVQPTPTITAGAWAQQGDAAFWQGDLDAAIGAYRNAARLAPNNVDIIYELARTLLYRSYNDARFIGDIDEALQWTSRLLEVVPNNSRAHTIHCFALVRARQSSAAVQSCIRAIDLNPNDSEPHAYLALAQYDLGRTASALDQAATAVRLNPKSIDGNMAYALALAFQGRVERALDHYKLAASVNPKLEFPYFQMAFYAYSLANVERNQDRAETLYRIALSAYNTILQHNPRSVKAYTRICQTYLAKGEPRLAREYCQEATSIDPTSSQAWRWLGEVYHKSRNYEDAVEALRTCAQLEERQGIPKSLRDPTCWWLRGVGYFILGDCNTAIPILDDVLTWTTDEIAIRETRRTIEKCATAYQGLYRTPTPIPTSTPRPTPIL